jgi:chromosome segregation ATPase
MANSFRSYLLTLAYSDADVEMLDISRSGDDPDTQIQRLMDKLRRAREEMRRMEDDLDRERRDRRRMQMQLADAQDNLVRTTRAAKSDVEDLKKANDRHLERIVELERELEKRNPGRTASVPITAPPTQSTPTTQANSIPDAPADAQIDSKEEMAKAMNEGL